MNQQQRFDDLETPGLFGEWLKRRRRTLDLTQEELAERAGCSIFALRKIESGERKPSKELAGSLAAALEITEQEKPTFIRVARGELNLERLRFPKADKPNASISDLLALQQTQETASFNADLEPAAHHVAGSSRGVDESRCGGHPVAKFQDQLA